MSFNDAPRLRLQPRHQPDGRSSSSSAPATAPSVRHPPANMTATSRRSSAKSTLRRDGAKVIAHGPGSVSAPAGVEFCYDLNAPWWWWKARPSGIVLSRRPPSHDLSRHHPFHRRRPSASSAGFCSRSPSSRCPSSPSPHRRLGHQTGAGWMGAIVIGDGRRRADLGVGQLLLLGVPPALGSKLLIALAFVAPAAVAGYHATHGIVKHTMPSEPGSSSFRHRRGRGRRHRVVRGDGHGGRGPSDRARRSLIAIPAAGAGQRRRHRHPASASSGGRRRTPDHAGPGRGLSSQALDRTPVAVGGPTRDGGCFSPTAGPDNGDRQSPPEDEGAPVGRRSWRAGSTGPPSSVLPSSFRPLQTASSMVDLAEGRLRLDRLWRNSARQTFFPCRLRRHSSRDKKVPPLHQAPSSCAVDRLRPVDRHRGRNGAGSKAETEI